MPAGASSQPARRPRSPRGRRPNLLLVVLDTLSAEGAGIGRVPATMPRLERLAAGGAAFAHAVTNAPWTYPAHASLLTGLLPSGHGMSTRRQIVIWEREAGMGTIAADVAARGPKAVARLAERWLPAMLSRAGYETVLASNNPWVGRMTQMDLGFGLIRDTLSVRLGRHRSVLTRPPSLRRLARTAYNAYRARWGRGDLLAADVARRIEEWAHLRDAGRPFFLMVNLMEAHAPYLTPESGRAVRAVGAHPSRRAGLHRAMALTEARSSIPINSGARPLRERDGRLRVLSALHRSAATYLDAVVARIVEVAAAQPGGLVACVTSDHGESFGDHGFVLHGFSMFEPGLRIPLVVWGPAIEAGGTDRTVELRQVYATLLGAAGIDPPDGAAPSLLDPPHRDVVAERDGVDLPQWAEAQARTERTGRLRAVYRDRWKLIATADGPRLFDLSADPLEEIDRAAREPALAADLATALPAWPAGDDHHRDDTRSAPIPDHGEAARIGLTDQEESLIAAQLSALGYLE